MFINNVNDVQQEEIKEYIESFISNVQSGSDINYVSVLFSSLKTNLLLVFGLWLAGLTVLGVFMVYGLICYKGFCIGYSISSVIATLGTKSGCVFIFSSMFLQNIVLIPALFGIAISRYKTI